jgi:hypothetical protein
MIFAVVAEGVYHYSIEIGAELARSSQSYHIPPSVRGGIDWISPLSSPNTKLAQGIQR